MKNKLVFDDTDHNRMMDTLAKILYALGMRPKKQRSRIHRRRFRRKI